MIIELDDETTINTHRQDDPNDWIWVRIDPFDLELFRQQRELLNTVIDDAAVTTPEQSEALQGIQNLCDVIYDQLAPID